ncbi:hypothetical protein BJY24_004955 [Nocardia transvalensis]|uniref:PucR C-terminal helix-turn-helix domain-containing protein n=1 Tax=Nocardia transvalensis TaxID=37333 RepID=A0A7W9PIC5_9NOCA|nr:helix-turn-helix domain-containing protein [Nocardia transvalensis]MBB5916043.1 hypothetical protein [Nocardia transvalensis]
MPQHTQRSATTSQHIETFARAVCDRVLSTAPTRISVRRNTVDGIAVARECLELAIAIVDSPEHPARVLDVERAAQEWARDGITIDTILDTLHDGVRIGIDLLAAGDRSGHEPALDTAAIAVRGSLGDADATHLALRVLHTMTTAITRAYVRHAQTATPTRHTIEQTLASALLTGHDTTMARRHGIDIAEEYLVLALAFRRVEPAPPGVDTRVLARRPLSAVHAELARRYRDTALPALSIDGGTVLLPSTGTDDSELESLITDLSATAELSVTAVALSSATSEIPATDVFAHELLDLTHRLGLPPGVYRFADLALEFQLTRPGPGLDRLSALLDPLDTHPELLDTLRCHLANNLNRQRTAHTLRLHTNTIDYRLKRIARLTGLDITRVTDLWYIRSALVAHDDR